MTTTDSTTAATAARAAWLLNDRFMLRVAGLPIETVHRLRCPDVADWAERALTEERRTAHLGEALSDPLAEEVGRTEDAAVRRRLLALRRQVFNNRLPSDRAAARATASAIGGETGRLLTEWLHARERWEELRGAGAGLLAAGLARSRAELRRLAADEERLRLGLLLASPTLETRLDDYIRATAAVPDKKTRKKERSLLAYLYRTACKTSPFSTFTGVALGGFRPSAEGHASPGADGRLPLGTGVDVPAHPDAGASAGPVPDLPVADEWRGHPRLNVVVLARLAELIAADPARRDDLPVALASGWKLDDDRVRYVQRAVTAGDDSAPVSFDAAQDRLFFLRRSGALQGMLGLFAQRPLIPWRELSGWLRDRTGALAPEAERYTTALYELGMLQLPLLATDVHAADPLGSFRAALRSLGRPWADQVADRLGGPAAAVAEYPSAAAARRRDLLTGLRAELGALQQFLGAKEPVLPQTLLYEDTAAGTALAPAETWSRLAAGPLTSLARILPAFDVALAQRLTLKGFFLARYGRGGRCDDLLRLVHDFHEDIFRQYLQFTATKDTYDADGAYVPEENWLGMAEITALDRARAALGDRMRARWAELPADAEEFVLDEETVEAVAAELAPAAPDYQPQSHFLQLARRDGEPLVVLNNSFGGLCFPFTRFTHCFPAGTTQESGDLTEALRATLRRWQPDGAVFAEITAGAATTNLNLHGRLTDHEIVCPGERSSAPPEDRIHLDDLYAEHDEAADRLVLRSRRLGREVVPLYLGYLVPMVLPEIPRTLLLLSPTARAVPDVWRGVPQRPAVDGVTCRPRVRYRSVVLQRRAWTVTAGALPGREPGDDDARWFLGWHRWRTAHGLPARVFAAVHEEQDPAATDGPGRDGGGEEAGAAWFGGSKPQYVDFDSPLSLLALEGLLARRRARVVLTEMLPGEQELHVRSARGHHVAELAVELVPRPVAPGRRPDGAQEGSK